MVDVSRIGGIPEPRPPEGRKAEERRRANAEAAQGSSSDGVSLSPEAQRAAEVLRFAEFARTAPDVRQEAVDAARERLERGDLDEPQAVRQAVQQLLDELG